MINETSVKLLATLDKLRKTYVDVNGGIDIEDDNSIDDIRHIICESPKIGHWIPVNPLQPDCLGALKCSVCGYGVWGLDPNVDKYCFNCGAKMEDAQSDKWGNENV